VIPLARTGRERRSKNTVIRRDQEKRGRLSSFDEGARVTDGVARKLIAPRRLDTPAR
jgi:hypothetical protein